MTDFKQQQTDIKTARLQSETIARQLRETKEKLRSAETLLQTAGRMANNSNTADIATLQKLRDGLQTQLTDLYGKVKSATQNSHALLNSFAQGTDPTKQITELDDSFPFLLFPLRLQTRFKTITQAGALQHELWLRIYPDDCQVSAKEDMLSESEITSVQSFWKQIWQAGGMEADQRGAWRNLVDNFGAGRASWITEKYTPLNPADKKLKHSQQDIILVIVPGKSFTVAQETAAFSFWQKYWRAGTDAAARDQAIAALKAAIGDTAVSMLTDFRPFNLDINPLPGYQRADLDVQVVKLVFPAAADIIAAGVSWLQAPAVNTLPERFVAMCYSNGQLVKEQTGNLLPDKLATGPDPSLPDNEQLKATDDGNLFVNDDLAWMVDFDMAIAAGMGMKISLTADQALTGFDKIIVLGLRLSSDAQDGATLLGNLFSSHYYSKNGFGLLPQGTPTNNTEKEAAGYSKTEDPDQSYNRLFNASESYAVTADPLQKKDGQWLAEYLGIDPLFFTKTQGAAGRDQGEARAMNIALWPATLGYFMEEMMHPAFSAADIAQTRLFFNQYVSGRGPVPAIRIGRQPYGILPATAFSRLSFNVTPTIPGILPLPVNTFMPRLYNVIKKIDTDWGNLVPGVAHISKDGDTDQLLVDILGLHSGSVEFHQRYLESLEHIYNLVSLQGGSVQAQTVADITNQKAAAVTRLIGYNFTQLLPILQKYFMGNSHPLTGPLVDDTPLSETDPIRKYSADGKNYIEWLAAATVEQVRIQDFGGHPAPAALLYLMLRHALMMAQADAAAQLHVSKGLETDKTLFHDPAFIQVKAAGGGKSKWEYLYKKEPRITGDDTQISDYIYKPAVLGKITETKNLADTLQALAFLEGSSTSALERVFTEHIDCCQYRLDAWRTGLVNAKLTEQRRLQQTGDNWSKGIYLGCYGSLENIRPKKQALEPVVLSDELKNIFSGSEPLVRDNTNLGFIHAPSLNQAATGAILRNAFETHKSADPQAVNPFAINLSSERVRLANQFLEGIRNGQSLAALLGYQFERGLHDKYGLGKGEVDKFIYPLRKQFPLVANQLKETQTTGEDDKNTPIDSLEARNVIDGLQLVKHIQLSAQPSYPFGIATGTAQNQLPVANAVQTQAISQEAQRLVDIQDAIADMVTAESVYQSVQGNFERAAGNTDAFSKGGYPPDIQVVDTPRTGTSLTQRVGIQFDTAASPSDSPSAVKRMTPRAALEPSVNKWLADILPPSEKVLCRVSYQSPVGGSKIEQVISQKDLGLQSIDLLYLFTLDNEQSMTPLNDRMMGYIKTTFDPHPGLQVKIEYSRIIDNTDRSNTSFFELAALIRSLRKLLQQSRALHAADIGLPQEMRGADIVYDHAQLADRLNILANDLRVHATNLGTLLNSNASIEPFIDAASTEFQSIALFGIPQAAIGFMYEGRKNIYTTAGDRLTVMTERWRQKNADYTLTMSGFDAQANTADMILLLQKAERLIATSYDLPIPPLNDYKNSIQAKKADFDTIFNQLTALLTAPVTSVTDYLDQLDIVLAKAAEHDAIAFNTDTQLNNTAAERILAATLLDQIKAASGNLLSELNKRLTDYTNLTDGINDIPLSSAKTDQLMNAAKKIGGDDVLVLPHFTLPASQGDELENAYNNGSSLLNYLTTVLKKTSPVDDWLYSLARVREKLFQLENSFVLAEGLRPSLSLALTPLQLPFQTGDQYRWLAMQYHQDDENFDIPSDTLLYTAHYALGFSKQAPQCGVLIDEWTEVIPSKQETTGISFHFDQPNTEPPQVMLLVVPPVMKGKWNWADLADSVLETFDLAKKRGVEPQQLDGTAYAQFLPATVMAVTLYWITVATNLANNNMIYDKINTVTR